MAQVRGVNFTIEVRVMTDEEKARRGWVEHFVRWAEHDEDHLDFRGNRAPRRLQRLLEHGLLGVLEDEGLGRADHRGER